MSVVRNELANNHALSNLDDRKSEVEKHLTLERRKLTETNNPEIQKEIRGRIGRLESALYAIDKKDRRGSKPSLRTEQISGRR